MAAKTIATEDYMSNDVFEGFWEWGGTLPSPWASSTAIGGVDSGRPAFSEAGMASAARTGMEAGGMSAT